MAAAKAAYQAAQEPEDPWYIIVSKVMMNFGGPDEKIDKFKTALDVASLSSDFYSAVNELKLKAAYDAAKQKFESAQTAIDLAQIKLNEATLEKALAYLKLFTCQIKNLDMKAGCPCKK